MIRNPLFASAVVVLLAALNVPAEASPASLKFVSAVSQAQQAAGSLTQAPDAFKTGFAKQLQQTLKDAKCTLNPNNSVDCSKADADSIDAGTEDLPALNDLVAAEKTRENALPLAKQQLGALGTQIAAALPKVNDALARTAYNKQLLQALGKDGCTLNAATYSCAGSPLTLDKLNAEIDGLKTLLAAVNSDNATNTRVPDLKNLTLAANQALAAILKVPSTQDQKNYQQQLDQRIAADGCGYVSGAYNCSATNLLPNTSAIDKEVAWMQALLAAVNAETSNPRPGLLAQLTQKADAAQASIATLPNPNDTKSLGQKLTQLMATDACRLVSGANDCSQTTVSTANLPSAIAAVQSLIDASMASRASDPNVQLKAQLMLALNKDVDAVASVQNPDAQASFKQKISDTATKDGCAFAGTYWDCTNAPSSPTMATDIQSVQNLLTAMASANVMTATAVTPLIQSFRILAGIIASIPNKDDVASLTAKLNAIVAEGGCSAKSGSYDCSATTYNQLQKATADAAALLPVVKKTASTDGPLADHANAAAAAATAASLGRQLSPQSARDAFNAAWLAALNKANCVATASSIDCSKATAAQLAQLNKDLAALQSQTQGSINKQESAGASAMPSSMAADMTKAMAILNNTDKMIDGAAIPDSSKPALYGKVSALRDQLEAQATGYSDTVSPTKTSGSFGPSPSALAASMMTQVQVAIVSATAH